MSARLLPLVLQSRQKIRDSGGPFFQKFLINSGYLIRQGAC